VGFGVAEQVVAVAAAPANCAVYCLARLCGKATA